MSDIRRFKGRSSHGKSGWEYKTEGVTVRGDWATGEREVIKDDKPIDIKKAAIIKAQEDGKRYRRQKEASFECERQWNALPETTHRPSYLLGKKVDNFGCKVTGDVLHVPAYDLRGKLWSVQSIFPNGSKMFYKGGRKKGCFHAIGEGNNIVFCEGYATGASILMAVPKNVKVVICFDAFNLVTVVKEWRKEVKGNFYIAADNDQWKPDKGNTGMAYAKYCCEKYGCILLAPHFRNTETNPTDFNDLHCLEGIGVVHDQIMSVVRKETP